MWCVPFLGEMDGVGGNWCRETFDLAEEVGVESLVGGQFTVVGRAHPALHKQTHADIKYKYNTYGE